VSLAFPVPFEIGLLNGRGNSKESNSPITGKASGTRIHPPRGQSWNRESAVQVEFRLTKLQFDSATPPKDELEIRPIWHHQENRVKAHILVCFLAFAVWKTMEGWMNRSGLRDASRAVSDQLASIKSGDVVLPTENTKGEASKEIRLRCVAEPESLQQVLLNRLGLKLPRRLRQSTD